MNLGPAKILNNLKECEHLHIVSVIASFDCDRNIRPLYFRVGNDALKIYNSVIIEDTGTLLTFRCEFEDCGYVKVIKLTYFKNERLWAMRLS